MSPTSEPFNLEVIEQMCGNMTFTATFSITLTKNKSIKRVIQLSLYLLSFVIQMLIQAGL